MFHVNPLLRLGLFLSFFRYFYNWLEFLGAPQLIWPIWGNCGVIFDHFGAIFGPFLDRFYLMFAPFYRNPQKLRVCDVARFIVDPPRRGCHTLSHPDTAA